MPASTHASNTALSSERRAMPRPLRLGFAGVGWIGRHRLRAAAACDGVDVAAVCDPCAEAVHEVTASHPDAEPVASFEQLLGRDLDGVVIATPSASHAEQSIAALRRGCAVFCQKPLARTRAETEAVIDAARAADRLLAVDLSYRHVEGMDAVRAMIGGGQLGTVYAVDLVFHNAYGPDKDWFYDLQRSGGGCLIDLGTHLIDLALWALGERAVEHVASRLFHQGRRLSMPPEVVEDCAFVDCDLADGIHLRVACSWRLPAGRDAVFEATFYGTEGAVTLRNLDGSFYRFVIERKRGTACETIAEPSENWGAGAITEWIHRLTESPRYRADCEHLLGVAEVLDRSYGR